MAEPTASHAESASSSESASSDAQLKELIREVANVYSTSDDLGRLHRPGAHYFNLNPFEVLALHHTASDEQIRSAYRKMSVQVHPDKHPDDTERATAAFEVVNAAYERLSHPERLDFCRKICSAAADAVARRVAKEKKALRKAGAASDAVPEDNPEALENSVRVMICRMFAEFETRKRELETRDAEAQDRAKNEAAEREFMEALEKREQRMWEKSRNKRVAGWRSWSAQGRKTAKVPNHVRAESRGPGAGSSEADYKKSWR